ncbi:hypothetical protein ABGB18_08685 [Nonomuraea sp. B12E4]|uniref:hypothetical protein n=1 Tax=Nonomuraea sp. B12E4 TaxID=3153564 RepID=UPI00325F5042
MSVDDSRTGEVHWYWIHASCAGLVPFRCWPQVPQPVPAPGFELLGVVASLTRWGFSHEAEPLVVIVADAPNSAVASRSERVTATVAADRRSPSSAKNRNV